jgi:hypothetical protein
MTGLLTLGLLLLAPLPVAPSVVQPAVVEQFQEETMLLLADWKPILVSLAFGSVVLAVPLMLYAEYCLALRAGAHQKLTYTFLAAIVLNGWSAYAVGSIYFTEYEIVQRFEARVAENRARQERWQSYGLQPPREDKPQTSVLQAFFKTREGIASVACIVLGIAEWIFFIVGAAYLTRLKVDKLFSKTAQRVAPPPLRGTDDTER